MNNKFKFTGGARLGFANCTWPLATLTITSERLDINASLIGSYSFNKEDIDSIEPYNNIPFIGQGIKIKHHVPNYKQKVIFWTFRDPHNIIAKIRSTGFLDHQSDRSNNHEINNQIINKQQQGGFPVKIPFLVSILVIWNLLFFADIKNYFGNELSNKPLGNGALIALGFLFVVSLLTIISKDFRKIVLKEGRELKEINRFLYFIMVICTVMFIGLWNF
jgi:hypothetical protein